MTRRVVARPNREYLEREGLEAARPERSEDGRPQGRSPRTVKRGESAKREAQQTIVDWLTFTFLPVGSIGDALEQLQRYFHLWFSIPVNFRPNDYGFRRYEHSTDVLAYVNGETVRLGIIGAGGEHVGGTICLDLSGTGCAAVVDWDAVFATVQDLDARITRCDLARDFCEGQVSVDQVESLYFAGEFNAGGRIPVYRRIESGVAGAGACGGRTLEIGRRKNGKMLRAYEKGRQLGNQESDWLRIEIEFRSKDRVVDHAILIDRDSYFVGAYKALESFLDADPMRLATDQKVALAVQDELVCERALDHAQHQYGKVVEYARLSDRYKDVAALVARITRRGVPGQAHKTALARHVYGAHDPAPVYRE